MKPGRIIILILGVVLGVVGSTYAIFGGEYPVDRLRELAKEREALEQRSLELEVGIAQGERTILLLKNDSSTIERAARERYGMIREGETLIRFLGESDSCTEIGVLETIENPVGSK